MLPQYSKQYKSDDIDGDEANEPFLNASHRASTETAPPTYPPGPSTTGQTGRSNVQYKYEPEYPRKGSNKAAVGLMGRTKQVKLFNTSSISQLNNEETIEIVQRGFPELAEYDQDRISFKTGDNAIIFDEAWEHFGQHPPEVLKVMVADAPGEAERREFIHRS